MPAAAKLEEGTYEVVEEKMHIRIRGETVRYTPEYKLRRVDEDDLEM